MVKKTICKIHNFLGKRMQLAQDHSECLNHTIFSMSQEFREWKTWFVLWLFLVPLEGGSWHIIPQLAVYTTYIPLIYCRLGGYIIPTTLYRNLTNPLISGLHTKSR